MEGAGQSNQAWLQACIGCTPVRPAGRAVNRSDVHGVVRIAKGGGLNVGGSEVGTRDESRNLGLNGVVTGLSSSVNGDRIVPRVASG